jgi:hypothetical protein
MNTEFEPTSPDFADNDPIPSFSTTYDVADAADGLTIWDKIFEQILAISRLETDWDGGGAPAVRPELIRSTMRLIHALRANGQAPPQDMYPLSDGNIILEWQFNNGVIWRIEVEGMEEGQMMITYPDKVATFSNLTWTKSRPSYLYLGCRVAPRRGSYDLTEPRWCDEELTSSPQPTTICSDYDLYQQAA